MSAAPQRIRLSAEEISRMLPSLQGWEVVGIHLTKRLTYPNFVAALDYVNRLGELAEAANHHPDIRFGWGYVVIELTTHDAGGITISDVEMAKKIDTLAA